MQEMHYVLARSGTIPKYPAGWGSPPEIPEELRQQVPYASGSYVWCFRQPAFYLTCGFSENQPGWSITLDGTETSVRACPVTWNLPRTMTSGSIDEAAARLGWKVLRRADLPAVAAQITEGVQSQLKQMNQPAATMIQVDPTTPGVLTMDMELDKCWGDQPSWACNEEQEPIGIQKGESLAIFTRHHFRASGVINVTYNEGLTATNVSDFAELMGEVSKGTGMRQVRMWDLDPTGPVATRLRHIKWAQIGMPPEEGIPLPLAHLCYDEDSSNGVSQVALLSQNRRFWAV